MVKDGGLKMVDVNKMHAAAKCSWVRRIVNDPNANWKILFLKMLLINENMLNKNLPASDTKNCLSNFHNRFYITGYKFRAHSQKLIWRY